MANRIRRSWKSLVDQLSGLSAEAPEFLGTLQAWVRDDPGSVSSKAASSLSRAPGVRLLLDHKPETLPLTKDALRELQQALSAAELPKDPEAFAGMVGRLCWRLAVCRRDDECCPAVASCDGHLEIWTDGNALFEVCDAFPSHCFDLAGREIEDRPDGLRPADRREILAAHPKAKRFLTA